MNWDRGKQNENVKAQNTFDPLFKLFLKAHFQLSESTICNLQTNYNLNGRVAKHP